MNTPAPHLMPEAEQYGPRHLPLYLFLITLAVCTALSGLVIKYRIDREEKDMEYMLEEKGNLLDQIITKQISKTEIIKSLLLQDNGVITDFESMASLLTDDPSIANILLAPGGVISHAYPLDGNERLIGYDLFEEDEGRIISQKAKMLGELVAGGPFPLVRGSLGVVGRMPVYVGRTGSKTAFWGFVNVTLKFPELLDGATLHTIEHHGFDYELWRYNPLDNQREVFAVSADIPDPSARFIERVIALPHMDWRLRIVTRLEWHQRPDNWLLLLSGLCVSAAVSATAWNSNRLVRVKNDVAQLLDTDALTGALNRAGLFRIGQNLIKQNRPFVLYYFDLDHFKHINDTHGHTMGDRVLTTFCANVGKHMTQDHVLGRMGGDEFILIYAPEAGPEPGPEMSEFEKDFWSRVEREFALPIPGPEGVPIRINFSLGRAVFPADGASGEELIHRADLNMYAQKSDKYAKGFKRRRADGP